MIELYPEIRLLHIVAALTSGAFFLLRGVTVQTGGQWAMAAPVRFLSYGIDTVLLAAAVLLVIILPASVYGNGWLPVKLVLLVIYIVLGTFALKRGRTARVRLICFISALLVFACMYAIARMHHPLGPFLVTREWLS